MIATQRAIDPNAASVPLYKFLHSHHYIVHISALVTTACYVCWCYSSFDMSLLLLRPSAS